MAASDYGKRTRQYIGFSFLDMKRESKRRLFIQKLNSGYSGPRIVAEGDSWFEYPYADDLIVQLGKKYAILSQAKAADSFAEVSGRGEELLGALSHPPQGKPFHIVMLSLGGNEVMGRIEDFARDFKLSRPDEDYLKIAEVDALLKEVKRKFDGIIKPIIRHHTQHIILHGYDYPDPRFPMEPGEQPNGAQWIGPPLKVERGIGTLTAYRCIVNMFLDRFNTMLDELAAKPEYEGRVHVVPLLGTIGKRNKLHAADPALWADEIHGSDEGFKRLAKEFDKVIKRVWVSMQTA